MWKCKECGSEVVMKRNFYDLNEIDVDGCVTEKPVKGYYCDGSTYVCSNDNECSNESSYLEKIAEWVDS